MTTRRGFLGAMLAAAMAPAIAKSGVLMPVKRIWTPPQGLILWGDGIHDDTQALQAWVNGTPVHAPDGSVYGRTLTNGKFAISNVIEMGGKRPRATFRESLFIRIGDTAGPTILLTPSA